MHGAASGPDSITIGSVFRELQQLAAGMKELRLDARGAVTSPAQLASGVLATLANISHGVVTFVGSGPPVLNEAQLAEVRALDTERAFVKYMTPLLWELRGFDDVRAAAADACPLVLVNSEAFVWLDNHKAPLRPNLRSKPDLFVTYAPFFTARRSIEDGSPLLYGVLADRSLQLDGGVRELYAAKLKLTDAAFGELCRYHQLCGEGLCRGMLLGRNGFWLYKSCSGSPIKLIKSTWAAAGSRELISSFFSDESAPPLVSLLRVLLRHFDARVRFGDAFLGAGATGRVFAVTVGPDRQLMALKVAVGVEHSVLEDEHSKLAAARALGAPVVSVVPSSLCMRKEGGGYLMREVCSKFVPTSATRIRQAFAALADLHCKGVFHGDARTANLLVDGASLKWADFMHAVIADKSKALSNDSLLLLAQKDALALASSILRCSPDDLPSPVVQAVIAYASDRPFPSSAASVACAAACFSAADFLRVHIAVDDDGDDAGRD